MTIISFCEVARDGVNYLLMPDLRKTDQAAIMFPVSAGVLEHIGFSKFLSILDLVEFDSTLELLSFDRSGEVYW